MWKQIDFEEYFENALGCHSCASLLIFNSFVMETQSSVEWTPNNFLGYFEKALGYHSGERHSIIQYFMICVEKKTNLFKLSNFQLFCDLCGNR